MNVLKPGSKGRKGVGKATRAASSTGARQSFAIADVLRGHMDGCSGRRWGDYIPFANPIAEPVLLRLISAKAKQ